MRLLAALLAPALLAAAPAADWRATVSKNAAGAFVIGNPAAKVKLVEYASYTCSHCADFSRTSKPVLDERMIRGGTVSLEFRHLIRDGVDLAAAVLARCTGPKGFLPTSQAIFAAQDDWLPRAMEWQQANAERLQRWPRSAQLRALADGAGLTALVQARGLSEAATDACFADAAEIDRVIRMTREAPASVDSTPSFFVDGQLVPHVGWSGLEPVLRRKGAR